MSKIFLFATFIRRRREGFATAKERPKSERPTSRVAVYYTRNRGKRKRPQRRRDAFFKNFLFF